MVTFGCLSQTDATDIGVVESSGVHSEESTAMWSTKPIHLWSQVDAQAWCEDALKNTLNANEISEVLMMVVVIVVVVVVVMPNFGFNPHT